MIVKGSRVRAKFFKTKPIGTYSIAGMQMKFIGDEVEIIGVVRHIRGDDPVAPKEVRVYIDREEGVELPLVHPQGCLCEKGHAELKLDWIKAILK